MQWHPVNSVRLIAERGNSPFQGEPVSGQYEWSYRERDAARWAELYGIAFVEPRGRVEFDPELLALACTAAKRLGAVEVFSKHLFSAMFAESLRVIDEAECARRAAISGLGADEFLRELRSPEAGRLTMPMQQAAQGWPEVPCTLSPSSPLLPDLGAG